MKTMTRVLIAVALLALLAACGNKGPLVRPSPAPSPPGDSMPVPAPVNPSDPAPQEQSTTPANDEAEPPVPADDGDDGNS